MIWLKHHTSEGDNFEFAFTDLADDGFLEVVYP